MSWFTAHKLDLDIQLGPNVFGQWQHFDILALDLKSNNDYVLTVHTPSFNMRLFTSMLNGLCRNYGWTPYLRGQVFGQEAASVSLCLECMSQAKVEGVLEYYTQVKVLLL